MTQGVLKTHGNCLMMSRSESGAETRSQTFQFLRYIEPEPSCWTSFYRHLDLYTLQHVVEFVIHAGFDINYCPIARGKWNASSGKWKRHPTCPIGQEKFNSFLKCLRQVLVFNWNWNKPFWLSDEVSQITQITQSKISFLNDFIIIYDTRCLENSWQLFDDVL
jgi:hypothetical protein